jgi:ribose 5-phosphate isomerase A
VDAKDVAARSAVQYVQSGMTMGIGTGSTSAYAITALGERIKRENLQIRAVPTSVGSREMAEALGIPLVDLSDVGHLDLTIDGADEVDRDLNLIKGGGGALVREKIVASASRELIIICDDSKIKSHLGTHPLPVAVVPYGYEATHRRLRQFTPDITLRMNAANPTQPFVTDDQLYIFDLDMKRIDDVAGCEADIRRIVGVVEVGLFTRMAARVIVGYADGHAEERRQEETSVALPGA